MSAVALERPDSWGGEADPAVPSLLDDLGGEPTLDEVIAGVWEGLAVHRTAACPVCGSEMRPDDGAQGLSADDSEASQAGESGGRAVRRFNGGRCLGCASTLS